MDISKLEQLPRDVLWELAINLDYADIIKLCQTNKNLNQKLCQQDTFWRRKLLKEYPDYEQLFPKRLPTLREEYERANRFSNKIIADINVFLKDHVGMMTNYLSSQYFNDFRNAIIQIYKALMTIRKENFQDIDDYNDARMELIYERLRLIDNFVPGRSRILRNRRTPVEQRIFEHDYSEYFSDFIEELIAKFGKDEDEDKYFAQFVELPTIGDPYGLPVLPTVRLPPIRMPGAPLGSPPGSPRLPTVERLPVLGEVPLHPLMPPRNQGDQRLPTMQLPVIGQPPGSPRLPTVERLPVLGEVPLPTRNRDELEPRDQRLPTMQLPVVGQPPVRLPTMQLPSIPGSPRL